MEVKVIRKLQDFDVLAGEWNSLLAKSASHVPFLRHEYLSSWWRTLGGGEWSRGVLSIVTARDENGSLCGIAPLFATDNLNGEPALMLLGSIEISDYLDLIASRTTHNLIVTVEQIVPHERVKQVPYLNLIPRFRTTAIVEAPYGAHPFSCLHVYDQDREHLAHYAQVGRDPETFENYLRTYAYGVASHEEYINLIGAARLASLRQVGGYL